MTSLSGLHSWICRRRCGIFRQAQTVRLSHDCWVLPRSFVFYGLVFRDFLWWGTCYFHRGGCRGLGGEVGRSILSSWFGGSPSGFHEPWCCRVNLLWGVATCSKLSRSIQNLSWPCQYPLSSPHSHDKWPLTSKKCQSNMFRVLKVNFDEACPIPNHHIDANVKGVWVCASQWHVHCPEFS